MDNPETYDAQSGDEVLTNLVYLTENITNLDTILIHLIQERIISINERTSIDGEINDTKKVYKLFVLLLRKNWCVIRPSILRILVNTGNSHCANVLQNGISSGKIPTAEQNPQQGRSTQSATQSTTTQRRSLRPDYNFTAPAVNDLREKPKTKIFSSKWWPEKKYLPNAFYERKSEDKLLVEKLRNILLAKENGGGLAVISPKLTVSGLAGIGKTTTAKWFALKYQTEYDYVLWIDCGEGSLLWSIVSLAKALKIQDGSELGTKELASKCYTILEESICLFVFDNAECYQGEQGIRNVLPINYSQFHVIITSRNTKWGSANGDGIMQQFKLGVFDENESVEFLRTNLKGCTNKQNEQLRIVSQLLGNLPLALQIAVAAINEEDMSLLEYINRLQNTEHIILSEFDDYEKTINKTMKISMDLIRDKCEGKLAHRILTTCGYLTPDNVSSIFITLIEGQPVAKIIEATRLLESYSLITKTTLYYQKFTISVHRLLQQVIRHNGIETKRETLTNIFKYDGFLEYKIIPYSYADAELKMEFPEIRDELMDKVKLNDLLSRKRFQESVDLSRLIQESQNAYVSQFNHAVCLKYNFQIEEAKEILENLYGEFKKVDQIEIVISKWGTITELKNLSGSILAGQLFLIYSMENKIDDAKQVVLESNGAVIPRESLEPFLVFFNAILFQNYFLKAHDDKFVHLNLQNPYAGNTFELISDYVNEVTSFPTNLQTLKLSNGMLTAWHISLPIFIIITDSSVDLKKTELDRLKAITYESEYTCMLQKILNPKIITQLEIKNLSIHISDLGFSDASHKEYQLLLKHLSNFITSNQIPFFSIICSGVIVISLSFYNKKLGRIMNLSKLSFDKYFSLSLELDELTLTSVKTPLQLTQFVDFSKVKKFTLELEADLDANDIEVNKFANFFLEGKLWFKIIFVFIKLLGRPRNILFFNRRSNSFSLTVKQPKKNPLEKLKIINCELNQILTFQDDVQELQITNKELLTQIEVPIPKLTLKDMKVDLSFPLTVNELVLDNVTFSDCESANWTINQLLVRKMNFVERRDWTVTEMTFQGRWGRLLDISVLPTSLKKLTVIRGIMPINSDTLDGEYVFPANIQEMELDCVQIKGKDGNDLNDVSNSLPPNLNKLKIDCAAYNHLSVSLSCIQSIPSLDLSCCTLIINRLTLITPNELTLIGVSFIDENGQPIPSIRANDFINFSQMQKLNLYYNKGLSVAECDTAHIKEVELGDTKIVEKICVIS